MWMSSDLTKSRKFKIVVVLLSKHITKLADNILKKFQRLPYPAMFGVRLLNGAGMNNVRRNQKVKYLLWRSRELIRTVLDVTGSQKSNMSTGKPEVIISQLVYDAEKCTKCIGLILSVSDPYS
jgi:hypothetical protein